MYQLDQNNVVTRTLAGDITQIGQRRARGFELEAKAELTDYLTMVGSYSYTDARITKSEELLELGQRSENTPYHKAALWMTYDVTQLGIDGLTVGGGVRYTGSTSASGIDKPIPVYTLVDAMVRYEVTKNITLSLNATNLFNEEYAVCEFAKCLYGDGREVMVSSSFKW